MKEWCLKHPFLTFLIIDEIIAGIQTIVLNQAIYSTKDEAIEFVGNEIIKRSKNNKNKEDKEPEPIGFKTS